MYKYFTMGSFQDREHQAYQSIEHVSQAPGNILHVLTWWSKLRLSSVFTKLQVKRKIGLPF